ncbi:uncharacterized protein LOC110982586 isoform X3 [Acanthaster planci]|nr:uncharacterized protein LOC110982586 isoform X3 [Acanthaster planci]
MSSSAFLEEIEQNPLLLLQDEARQRPIVNFTSRQEEQMLLNFPQLFRTQAEFAESQLTSGTVTVLAAANSTRRRRADEPPRVCPSVSQTMALVVMYRPDGQVVQLGQPQGVNQWILNEVCDTTVSALLATGQECGVISRHVLALFVNLSEIKRTGGRDSSRAFDFAEVVVQSCVTLAP